MRAPCKIVVTDHEYESLHWEEQEAAKVGAVLAKHQCRTREDLLAATRDADAVLVQYANISRPVIEQMEKCRLLVRYGVGVDCIDVQAATQHGIMVANVPDYGLEEVADHTLALMLNGARKICQLHESVKRGQWNYKISKPIYRLRGKKLGLVAFGNIARLVAGKARAFGLQVQVYDPFIKVELAAGYGADLVDFDTLLASSDIISLHAPVTEQTYHLFNRQAFQQMKKGCILVNTARGSLIEEEALVEALRNGHLGFAALDVAGIEPMPAGHPLTAMENVILTPHAAWYSEEAQESLQRQAAQEVSRVLRGEAPHHLVNRNVVPRNIPQG